MGALEGRDLCPGMGSSMLWTSACSIMLGTSMRVAGIALVMMSASL